MGPGKSRERWSTPLLAVLCLLLATEVWSQEWAQEDVASTGSTEQEQLECHVLERQSIPESAGDWLERSLQASHCYEFKARAVRIGFDGVRTLAITQDIDKGIERQVARFLDGPPGVFERRGPVPRLTGSGKQGELLASPADIVRHIDGLYRLELMGEERIANRRALRLDIEPLDNLRFGQRLWLDVETALPLKQMLIDEGGGVVETFQLTDIEAPRLHEGSVDLDRRREPPSDPWQIDWLPEGFLPQPMSTPSPLAGDDPVHRLYSDGLSTLSVFVEPLDEVQPLLPGMHRLGVSHAAVRHRTLAGQPVQVVVMGELPRRVLSRVADALQ
jgi:sigma-E factor negative regulatory protein RseB